VRPCAHPSGSPMLFRGGDVRRISLVITWGSVWCCGVVACCNVPTKRMASDGSRTGLAGVYETITLGKTVSGTRFRRSALLVLSDDHSWHAVGVAASTRDIRQMGGTWREVGKRVVELAGSFVAWRVGDQSLSLPGEVELTAMPLVPIEPRKVFDLTRQRGGQLVWTDSPFSPPDVGLVFKTTTGPPPGWARALQRGGMSGATVGWVDPDYVGVYQLDKSLLERSLATAPEPAQAAAALADLYIKLVLQEDGTFKLLTRGVIKSLPRASMGDALGLWCTSNGYVVLRIHTDGTPARGQQSWRIETLAVQGQSLELVLAPLGASEELTLVLRKVSQQ